MVKKTIGNLKKFVKNFSTFVRDSNFVDVAIGLLIATAIKDLANSLQTNIIIPCINAFFSFIGIDVEGAKQTVTILGAEIGLANFIAAVLTFFMIMFVAFIILFIYTQFREKLQYEKPVEKTKDTELLEQILEELRKEK